MRLVVVVVVVVVVGLQLLKLLAASGCGEGVGARELGVACNVAGNGTHNAKTK